MPPEKCETNIKKNSTIKVENKQKLIWWLKYIIMGVNVFSCFLLGAPNKIKYSYLIFHYERYIVLCTFEKMKGNRFISHTNNIKICIYLQINTKVLLMKLVPVFDEAIPACGGHLARLVWMP